MALTGLETLFVLGQNPSGVPAASTFQTTTAAIAALASTETAPFIVTPITTVGNGTLTAAGIVGGEIIRTGPVAAFSDATDTAAAIIAALPGAVVGSSFTVLIKNATIYTQTITAGTGVTLPSTVIVPAYSVIEYNITVSTASTLTWVHISTVPISSGTNQTAPVSAALSTVGAGTITAAMFVGGIIARSGSQSGTPFTDTTDTAAAIIAASANLVNKIGTSMLVEYANNTNAIATIVGGTGVTASGVTVIPANTIAYFLLTYTAAATMTMVGLGVSPSVNNQLTLAGATSGQTILKSTDIAVSGTLTLPTVTGVVASTTGANLYLPDLKRCSASVTANNTATYANVTGLSFTVVPGTYEFVVRLPSTVASGTGGIKYAFNYTTTALTSIEATGRGFTAAAVAVQHTTTTTTQTDIFTQAAVVIYTEISGTMVVSTGGTVDVQMAQNTANASNTIALIGASGQFTRIA